MVAVGLLCSNLFFSVRARYDDAPGSGARREGFKEVESRARAEGGKAEGLPLRDYGFVSEEAGRAVERVSGAEAKIHFESNSRMYQTSTHLKTCLIRDFFSFPSCRGFAHNPGNHEHYTGQAQEWADFVAERGFTVLNVRSPRDEHASCRLSFLQFSTP